MISGSLQREADRARLETWKEISDFLGRSTRTVQRWHAEFGLPIYRAGGERGNVFAFPDELHAWMTRRRDLPPGIHEELKQASSLHASNLTRTDSPAGHGVSGSLPQVRPSQAAAELVDKAESIWRALSTQNITMITSLFRAATDLDPTNPRAYAGLAHSLIFQGLLGPLRIPDAYHSATVAAEFAARLAASDAWIKSPVAWLKVVHERDWEQAYILFNEMLCCDDPSNVACTGFCLLLVAAGQLERAADLLFLAAHRFALSTAYRGLHCWTDYLARDFVQVEEHITQSRLAAQDGDTIGHIEALLLLQTNTPEEALPKLNAMHLRRRDHPLHRAAIAHALAKTGQTKEAGQILDQLRQHRSHGHRIPHYSIAIVLIALKRYEEAVRALEKSYQVGSLFSLGFHADPILEPLHSRADFQAFIRRAYPLNLEFS